MYFWNIEKLTHDLKKWISEEENFKYFFIWTVITTFLMSFPMESWKYDTIFNLIEALIWAILIFHTFKINKWNDWENFLSRLISITFVSSIRSLVFFLILIIIAWSFLFILWIDNVLWIKFDDSLFWNILILLFLFIYYFITIKYFKKLNHK